MNKRDAIDPQDPIIDASAPATQIRSGDRLLIVFMLLLVLLSLCVKFSFWFRFPANQDEFSHLARVYAHERGELGILFQTFHVHCFHWLRYVNQNELTQVMAGRLVMSVFFLGTCLCLLLLGRQLLSPLGALFSLVCYISFSFTAWNGGSFRPDAPATFLFMFGMYRLAASECKPAASAVAGMAMAVACLLTVKAGLYFVAFGGLFLIWRWNSAGTAHLRKSFLYFASSFVLVFGLMFTLHRATFPHQLPGEFPKSLGGLCSRYLISQRPQWGFLYATLRSDSFIWFLLAAGAIGSFCRLLREGLTRRRTEACLIALSLPALSLILFRNTYPYFYAFILPTAMLLAGYGFQILLERVERLSSRLSPTFVAVSAVLVISSSLPLLSLGLGQARRITDAQHTLIAEIHKVFPVPVAYVDGSDMVPSFPKVGLYMASVNMASYLRTGKPIFQELLSDRHPAFLLANVPGLDLHAEAPPDKYGGGALLEQDWAVLKASFVHHWGPLWVAGKRFDSEQEGYRKEFEVLVPGVYTVEGGAGVLIDGKLCYDGAILVLEQGRHSIEVAGAGMSIVLRWGDHLYRPRCEPVARLFAGPLD